MRRLLWTLIGVVLTAALTTSVVLALNYEGEDFCEHAKAWPGGTYLGQMHPYHSEFYRGYAERRGWDPCTTWAEDQRNSAIRGLRELGYTVLAPAVSQAPAAAPESTPAPDPGDWTYFGPECPTGYTNCASFASDDPFISLDSYDDTNESFYDKPLIDVSCFRGQEDFTLESGGPWIALGETGVSFTIGDGERVWFRTDAGSDDLEAVWFDPPETRAILGLLAEAERRNQPLKVGATSDGGTVVAWFDVTGFATNRARLPC